ncbi:MAG: enolase C-terminal domain-like protein [Deinococcota bacterium]
MSVINALTALEILDSRGRPTVQVTCTLASGASAAASVPSGASTGQAEAWELRDGDMTRFGGLGCQQAVQNVNTVIRAAIKQHPFKTQADLDEALIELDGTANKQRLGANALLGVSLAFARAQAHEQGIALYQHFATMVGLKLEYLPRLTINLFSGGKHAGGQVAIQDVLVVPTSATTIRDSLAHTYAVLQSAIRLIETKYHTRPLKADEGGLAPAFTSEDAMIDDAVQAIQQASFQAGEDIALAVDVASSHFYQDNHYHLGQHALTAPQMIDHLKTWLDKYPIMSLEDGLAEEDWSNWTKLTAALGQQSLILGDDFLCTNPERIQRAAEQKAANALLLKVNQIGTLTEAARALKLARDNHWQVVVSARSGETEDNWLADLATGWQADFMKVGSIQQSERLAKYNRLLAIEAETKLPLRQGL